jgi:benzoate/toluate 1,2-dioxygenase reductase component
MNNLFSQSRAAKRFKVPLSDRIWLTTDTFEVRFERPVGFEFVAGQKIALVSGPIARDYTLINAPQDRELAICVRHVPQGKMTPILAKAPIGQVFDMTPAFGFFIFQPSQKPAVFVASGTGIAPFVAFVRAGVREGCLLHGVHHFDELYYRDLLAPAVDAYIACLSRSGKLGGGGVQRFSGRVTSYLSRELPSADYDFYLCGGGAMVRDVLGIVDERFPTSRVFSEIFY